jgi:hypothetical protein
MPAGFTGGGYPAAGALRGDSYPGDDGYQAGGNARAAGSGNGYGSAARLGASGFYGNGFNGNGSGGFPAQDSFPGQGAFPGQGSFTGRGSTGPAGAVRDLDSIPIGGDGAGSRGPAAFQGPAGPATPAGGFDQRAGAQRGSRSHDVPVVTGVPVSRDVAPPFDVFSRVSRASDSTSNGAGNGGGAGNGSGVGPGSTGPQSAYDPYQGAGYENIDENMGYQNGGTSGGEDMPLPRRVRQANLAPQLRNSTVGGNSQTGVPQARASSLQDMRNTLSAMQRGWQQGRTKPAQRDTEGNGDGS